MIEYAMINGQKQK